MVKKTTFAANSCDGAYISEFLILVQQFQTDGTADLFWAHFYIMSEEVGLVVYTSRIIGYKETIKFHFQNIFK